MIMREFKFRAYHKEAKEMLYDEPHYVFDWEHEGQPIEIMQYTGLKDKNGKEIYEGDVVKVDYPLYIDDRDKIYEICWDNISYTMRRKKKDGNDWPERSDGMIYTTWRFTEEVEVIGNIHSNPELI